MCYIYTVIHSGNTLGHPVLNYRVDSQVMNYDHHQNAKADLLDMGQTWASKIDSFSIAVDQSARFLGY